MSRGFLIGAGWGTVVAGFGLVVASQISDLRPANMGDTPPAVEVTRAEPPGAPQDAVPELAGTKPAGQAPSAPSQTEGPSAQTAPDAPIVEDMRADVVAEVPETLTASVPDAQTSIPVPDAPGIAGLAPVAPLGDAAAPVVEQGTALPDSTAADMPPGSDATPPTAFVVAEAAPEPVEPEPEAVAESAPAAEAPVEPVPATEPVDAPAPRPTPGFGGKVEGVKTGRLPSISAGSADEAAEPVLEPDTMSLGDDPDLPPIERFAAEFENPANKPLFAILLQDTGGPDLDREALAGLDIPVTFVIDPTQPDAASAARIYRAQGKEVLMLAAGIPDGAKASDLSVSMEVITAAVPEAVGVVDLENGGFQGNRTLATQVLALVRDQGRGVLSWDRGLNAASQVARREGMRSALIFRSLDNEGESSQMIRQYLDRAAFKAAQDGRVVVAGKTRPETVAALLEWAVEGRAATVTLAPSTAVMTSQ